MRFGNIVHFNEQTGDGTVYSRTAGNVENQPGALGGTGGGAVHTISNLETGRGNVMVETLLKVAKALGYAVRIGP